MGNMEFQRRRDAILQWLMDAGPDGAMGSQLAQRATDELGMSHHSNGQILAKAMKAGIIFGKKGTDAVNFHRVRYFSKEEWCDACHVEPMTDDDRRQARVVRNRIHQKRYYDEVKGPRARALTASKSKPEKPPKMPKPPKEVKAKGGRPRTRPMVINPPKPPKEGKAVNVEVKKKVVIPTGPVIVPDHVKIQVVPGFVGDYRIQVDSSHRGLFIREWEERRSA